MRFLEPVFRPRLFILTTIVGVVMASTLTFPAPMPVIGRITLCFAFSMALGLCMSTAHLFGLMVMYDKAAGLLSSRWMLPNNEEVATFRKQHEYAARLHRLESHPMIAIVMVTWFAPEPIEWRELIDLQRKYFWRPFPAILVGCVVVLCTFFLAIWIWAFRIEEAVVSQKSQL